MDEVGRGAWAGPVVAGAVILPLDIPDLKSILSGVRDSKQCSVRQRTRLNDMILQVALATSIGIASAEEIDRLGIADATRLAMTRALENLALKPDALLIDYLRLPLIRLPQKNIIKGDQKSLSIAASSIIAKVARDQMMVEFDREYPTYGFDRHKGYGTPDHKRELGKNGPCPIHRLSFSPFRPELQLESHEDSPRT